MKYFVGTLIISLLISCNKKITESDLQYLNGYWEIEKVITSDKSVKEYKINTTYDYIEVKGKEGFRKKVYPQLMGKFQTNDDSETLTIAQKDNYWIINYKSDNNTWSEILTSLSEQSFVVKNEAGITYFYKKVNQ